MFRRYAILFLGSAILAACSGGGGSGGGSSSSRSNFLKVKIPQVSASSSMMSAGGVSVMAASAGSGVSYLQTLVRDQNTASDCAGPIQNIPFIVCNVGYLGINGFGTFEKTLDGSNYVATVSDLNGVGGYNIEAVITKDGDEVFRYKGNTEGTKGEVAVLFHELVKFPHTFTYEYGAKITWDGTNPADSKVEYTTEAFENEFGDANYYDHAVAFIDQTKNLADIITHTYNYRSGGPSVGATVIQTRVQNNKAVDIQFECSDSSSPVKGVDCFKTGWTIFDYQTVPPHNQGHIVAGTVDPSNYYYFTYVDGEYLTGSDGSYAVPASPFSDTSLNNLLTTGRGPNSEVFEVAIDKAGSASGTGLQQAIHAIKAKTFNDLNSILPLR